MGSAPSQHELQLGLILAVVQDNVGDVMEHLRKGTDPNFVFVTPINGPISPLYLACIGGKIAIVIHLLQAGANPNQICGNQCATPLIQAATYGYVDIMKLLLAKVALTSIKDGDGDTALHMAALKGEVDAAILLLRVNASVHARNNKQWTPLHSACVSGSLPIILALKAAGADTHASDVAGLKPAALALLIGHSEAAAVLMAVD